MVQLGSIEAGGTKFVCAVGDSDLNIIEEIVIPTTTPDETLAQVTSFFKQYPDVKALSVASFGPIEINTTHPKYGYITSTPKLKWQHTDLLGRLKADMDIPMYFTTDVNGSAYGEYQHELSQGRQINSLVYYTIGTGVGGGAVVNGHILGGAGHPEMGHVHVKRHPKDTDFKGICPYHNDCLEGLVSGPTFEARLNQSGKDVPISHPVWDILAYYVAQIVMQQTLILRPNAIVFGGGVVSEAFLEKVRSQFKDMMQDYLQVEDLKRYIKMPAYQDNKSATYGNFALAAALLKS
ncbi:ROK family protein [Staphylococcus massiliensis]|uniref:fructokinase n=1 Tax=Staphylococcus massiliensis S46 TaxID=1229783 RepID=K9B8E9_9STAP|nr:ROK family protein [Staphylococcus massiliensis]EKU50020.1 fructokinase / branched chain amino acid: 2-keto-4-methylthiobutyrate aminotransferase [Staphylococcus massiliensis S46]MCG3399220.1 ROK family protein [Staphylococcus massiliensis]MCG3413414.1 ROK family protein [Staphylococcus massiliensis]PNZ98577.1 fructokinase/branched chain amino acid--2-keto-4-methylthiobutyrate aminotransferase [Staphylococcus massiliensis CCUG 55927]